MNHHTQKSAWSERGGHEEVIRRHKSPVLQAVKNLVVALEVKSSEDDHFREKVLANTQRQELVTREQLAFLVGELRSYKTDRGKKAQQIIELKRQLTELKREMSVIKSILQSALGASLLTQKMRLDRSAEKEGRSAEHIRHSSGGAAVSNSGEENDGIDSSDHSFSVLHSGEGGGSQPIRGEDRSEYSASEIVAASKAPPSDTAEELLSSSKMNKSGSDSSSESASLKMGDGISENALRLQNKRRSSSAESLERLKKKKNDNCSDCDSLSELQKWKNILSTGEHPLLQPKMTSLVLQFIGKGHYLYVCGVHSLWKFLYEKGIDSDHNTNTIAPLESASALDYACDCGLDVKAARFKSNATGFPLSLSWWTGHIASLHTIMLFHAIRKGDPMNICGGAASAGRLDILQNLLEKQHWRCDNTSICINAAEAPKPNVLQWLFLNGIGKWDMPAMGCMLRSAALFNRHRNAHFLSLVSKYRRRQKQKDLQAGDVGLSKTKELTSDRSAIAAIKSSTTVGVANDSAANGSAAKRRRTSSDSTSTYTGNGQHTAEKDNGASTLRDAPGRLRKTQHMLEIAKTAIGYIEKQYDGNTTGAATIRKPEKVVVPSQPGGSCDGGGGKDNNNNTGQPKVDLRTMTSEKGAESGVAHIDKAPVTLSRVTSSQDAKTQPAVHIKKQRLDALPSSCGVERTALPSSTSVSPIGVKEATALYSAKPIGKEEGSV